VADPDTGADLTARFTSVREVLHIEIAAAQALLSAQIEGMDAQRAVLLAGLNERTRLLQEELDRRFRALTEMVDDRRDSMTLANRLIQEELDRRLGSIQLQSDQRFEASRETLTALKEMLDERYATQTKALDAAFKAAEQAVAVALANAEKATIKAEEAADKRFASVNEFRETLADQTATFIPRSEHDTAYKAMEDHVSVIRDDLNRVAAQVVPRNETEGWRAALVAKIDDIGRNAAERLGALELRLTSRLDLSSGEDRGADRLATEHRLDLGVILQVMAVLISVAAIVVVLLLRK